MWLSFHILVLADLCIGVGLVQMINENKLIIINRCSR